jgi:hypothetical protein
MLSFDTSNTNAVESHLYMQIYKEILLRTTSHSLTTLKFSDIIQPKRLDINMIFFFICKLFYSIYTTDAQ